ncbi:hypothetical protein NDU88_007534 [Pleurodeles waltl]|uniref:Myb-like domain-containing protein n=1 Tax=Pleurodeles waltl TaxID=8319 RepID=A0AAV7N661_PLEWA|nr:hypothetical protein NDU88_007534 [Pleurodeles waltl]
MDLWRRIVDRVNTVRQHPRTRDDIRKRWNDLRRKVRSIAARHPIAVHSTGGGPPPLPPQLTAWEEQVLAILHPEGWPEYEEDWTLVSAHQKKGIWRAIAKEVWTLGVYGRWSIHCRKQWEDLRRWARKTSEAQLGMAS